MRSPDEVVFLFDVDNTRLLTSPEKRESIYKIYAESFRGENHLRRILEEAQAIINEALKTATSQDKSTALIT
jgi:phosphoglucomutase